MTPLVRVTTPPGGEFECAARFYDGMGRQFDVEAVRLYDQTGGYTELGWPWQLPAPMATEPNLATITAAPPTAGVALAPDFTVTVNGTSVPTYERLYADYRVFVIDEYGNRIDDPDPAINGACVWAQTEGNARVSVTVAHRGPITSARIIPSRKGITTEIEGDVVSFTLPSVGHYELQINGSEEQVLYLHPGPPILDAPAPSGDPKVHYYAPGGVTKNTAKKIHYFAPGVYTVSGSGRFDLDTNDTVYLADGCVFKGKFVTKDPNVAANWKSNIRVYGYGVIDLTNWNDFGFWLHDVNGLRLENYTIHNPGGFTHKILHVKNVLVDGVKMYGYRTNSDALDMIAWQDFEVRNFFSRGFDDGLVIKSLAHANEVPPNDNYPAYPTVLPYTAAEINVARGWLHHCCISSDVGIGACEIGGELWCTEVSDILFEDIDVLHTYHKAPIEIHVANTAAEGQPDIHDITYRRIYVEDFHGAWKPTPLERFHFGFSLNAGSGGKIHDIYVEDVYFTGTTGSFPARMRAESDAYAIDGIHFSNIYDHGVKVTTQAGLNISKTGAAWISNITVA